MEICYLVAVCGEDNASVNDSQMVSTVQSQWESIDDELCGNPIEVHTDKNRHRVEKLILNDHRVTVTELME